MVPFHPVATLDRAPQLPRRSQQQHQRHHKKPRRKTNHEAIPSTSRMLQELLLEPPGLPHRQSSPRGETETNDGPRKGKPDPPPTRGSHRHPKRPERPRPNSSPSLEDRARAFFQLANVCDRRERKPRNRGGGSFQLSPTKLYRNVFAGREAVDAMVASGLAATREDALALGHRLASELRLFARANPPTLAPTARRADLPTAQTILLGKGGGGDRPTEAAAPQTASIFCDDDNAFYRFGPGVLTILRGMDRPETKAGDSSAPPPPPKSKARSKPNGTSASTTDEESTSSLEGSFEPEREPQLQRNLSIVPNAPGKHNATALEDLFRVRDAAPGQPTTAKKTVHHPKKQSKRAKKQPVEPAAAPSSTGKPRLPKSILKNSLHSKHPKDGTQPFPSSSHHGKTKSKSNNHHRPHSDSSLSTGTKKSANGNHTKNKSNDRRPNSDSGGKTQTKHGHKPPPSDASKGKTTKPQQATTTRAPRNGVFSSLNDNTRARRRGGSKPRVAPVPHQTTESTPAKPTIAVEAVSPPEHAPPTPNPPGDDPVKEGGQEEDARDNALELDDALESLDDIISNSTGLLIDGDDNASTWTEFIVGTARIAAAQQPATHGGARTKTPTKAATPKAKTTTAVTPKAKATKAKAATPKAKTATPTAKVAKATSKAASKTKAEARLASHKKKPEAKPGSKAKPETKPHSKRNEARSSSSSVPRSAEPRERKERPTNEPTKKTPAKAPLEIDLSDWAMDNHRVQEHRRMPPSFTKSSTTLVPGGALVHDDAPDDMSLLFKDQPNREPEALREKNNNHHHGGAGDGGPSRGNADKENHPSRENHHPKAHKHARGDDLLSGTQTGADAFHHNESFRSNSTKDSADLAKLRKVPWINHAEKKQHRDHHPEHNEDTRGRKGSDEEDRHRERDEQESTQTSSKPQPLPPPPLLSPNSSHGDDDTSRASDDETRSDSGIMEAIENDPFYQRANAETAAGTGGGTSEHSARGTSQDQPAGADDSDPPALEDLTVDGKDTASKAENSVPESYNDSYFDCFNDENTDGGEGTYDTYSDEGSYMELTVDDEEELEEIEEEIIEEVIEEEVIEEEEVVEEKHKRETEIISESNGTSHNITAVAKDLKVSPRRRLSKLQAARYLPPVPEFGPEPEPEPESKPKSPQRKTSVYVEVHSMPDDDDMTQITMDNCFLNTSFRGSPLSSIPEDDYTINNADYTNHNSYLNPMKQEQEAKKGLGTTLSPSKNPSSTRIMINASQFIASAKTVRQKNQFSAQQQLKKRTKHVTASSSLSHRCKSVLPTETSQQRIQEILWKDLSNSDVTVVWSALEELRILVATEARSRAYLVRHGGVMVIIDTMEEQLEVEVVQFLCCNILEQLVSVDFEIGLTILELGGVSLIEQSMKKHTGSHRVKEMGNAALARLSRTP